LRAVVCQRCHFLRFYDTALNVIVSPDDYPKLMAHLKEKVALIVLMIDLLDFPCSIWPGIMNVIGKCGLFRTITEVSPICISHRVECPFNICLEDTFFLYLKSKILNGGFGQNQTEIYYCGYGSIVFALNVPRMMLYLSLFYIFYMFFYGIRNKKQLEK